MAGRCISCGRLYESDELWGGETKNCVECLYGGELAYLRDELVRPWQKLVNKGYRVRNMEYAFAHFRDSVDCVIKIHLADEFEEDDLDFFICEETDVETILIYRDSTETDRDALLHTMVADILEWVHELDDAPEQDDDDEDDYDRGYSDGYSDGHYAARNPIAYDDIEDYLYQLT